MKKVAVILSGCGNRDGSELQETLSALLALDKQNITYQCFAPQGELSVVSYFDGSETGEKRDIFAESARIARGNILDVENYKASDYDALVIPGGMGAARNLSTYAYAGEQMQVLPVIEKVILDTYKAHKPICAMCIAPIVLAKVLGQYGVKLTLGTIDNTAAQVAHTFGANLVACAPEDACVDEENKVITTPAYMVASRISEIFAGAESMINALSEYLR